MTTSGLGAVGVGYNAYGATTTHGRGTAIGAYALQSVNHTQDDYNVAVGYRAGYNGVTILKNTYVGSFSGYENLGQLNTFVGYQSGRYASSGSNNTFIGNEAGLGTISAPFSSGGNNTAVG